MFEELERRRAEAERTHENSARHAHEYAKFETDGQGFIEFEKRVNFELTFIEEPFVSYCSQIDLDDFLDQLGQEVDANMATPPAPLVSGYVTEWDIDDRDFYIGCWVGARVYFPPEDGVPLELEVNVKHFFTFAAIAMKDVPLDESD